MESSSTRSRVLAMVLCSSAAAATEVHATSPATAIKIPGRDARIVRAKSNFWSKGLSYYLVGKDALAVASALKAAGELHGLEAEVTERQPTIKIQLKERAPQSNSMWRYYRFSSSAEQSLGGLKLLES